MDATPDPRRERLDRVAGLSRLAPRGDYVVGGLSFGSATLRRNPTSGRWDSLTLLLAPGAAADGAKAVKPKATTVVFSLMHWLEHGDFVGEDDLAPGLYSLIVDGALLSNPAWLTDAAPIDPALDPAAARALAHLRTSLTNVTHLDATCPVCVARRGRHAMSFRSMSSSALTRQRIEFLRRLGVDVTGLFDEPASPEAVCPHTAMRHEALRALFVASPELAFEAADVLIAAPALSPLRFVMSPVMMRGLIGAWLMGRAHPGLSASHGVARPKPAPPPTPRAGDALLSEGQRAALAFAMVSWGFDGPLEAFAPAMNDDSAAAPVMAAATALQGVALVWPDGVAKPAPRLPEAAPPQGPPKRAEAPPKRPGAASQRAPSTPTPGQELMTPELRALGYSDAAIRQLLKDGTIERAGYGWFRWKGC